MKLVRHAVGHARLRIHLHFLLHKPDPVPKHSMRYILVKVNVAFSNRFQE
jgi:hypothetical protein